MTQKIFVSAFVAGAAVGVLAAVLQFIFVIPLLLEGELYETGERLHFSEGAAESVSGAPAFVWDISRHGLTIAFNVIVWIGFALVLVALMAISATRGKTVDAKTGALWGVMAFFAVQLAPAAGLPPELPGTVAADVTDRYIWWSATIFSAAIALAFIVFRPGPASIAIATVLFVAPHVFGAPHMDTYFGVAPPELSAHFVTRSLSVAAVAWVCLGTIAGWMWDRD